MSPSLGTVRGAASTNISFDGGKSWLALGAHPLPIMLGSVLRSTGGSAYLELREGTRVAVLPFSAVRVIGAPKVAGISLAYGRLAFDLPRQSGVDIVTPSARLEPASGTRAAGEVFVSGGGLMGVKMSAGTLNVRSVTDPSRVMVASLDPMFVPARPSTPGAYFLSDAPATPPPDAKGVYAPSGQSVGFLGTDGRLVISPGYTHDLTRPYSAKLVRLAMNTIPDTNRSDATPLFDVNGGYTGYLARQVFYAQQGPSLERELTGQEALGAEAPRNLTSTGTIAGTTPSSAGGIGVGEGTDGGADNRRRHRHHGPPPCPPAEREEATPDRPPSGRPRGCPGREVGRGGDEGRRSDTGRSDS